jgi:hypothetical protein
MSKVKSVIYQPLSTVIHYEGVTSGTNTSAGVKSYQVENNKKLYDIRNIDWLFCERLENVIDNFHAYMLILNSSLNLDQQALLCSKLFEKDPDFINQIKISDELKTKCMEKILNKADLFSWIEEDFVSKENLQQEFEKFKKDLESEESPSVDSLYFLNRFCTSLSDSCCTADCPIYFLNSDSAECPCSSDAILIFNFLKSNLKLIDFKIEFGNYHGQVVLADEISPDTCRLWDATTNEKMDKDRFRRDLGNVEETYREVLARITKQ